MVAHPCILINERDALIETIRKQKCFIYHCSTGLKIFVERYNEVVKQLEQLQQKDTAQEQEQQRRTATAYPTPPGQAQSPFPSSNHQGIDVDDFDENDYLLPEGYDPAYVWKFYSESEDGDNDEYESESEGEECVNDHLPERMCVRRDCHQFGFCREHELSAACVCNGGQ
ncbi:uncharacterized protein EURHEDRAFT_539416 [Aspergillus ruber CBS 135680]|uniref:Uncharacterized protein n=1 Tax=Aspergillus ruber (strain CBS 135680) TaxID=1388766 RepID=A0A017SBS0_ASPRC|nr:uncharacterized protein EURHEDRAFT_539416 [Aspergillus ruber CBS 135680]EYE94261.1 hypothetical protein EURHEDRAFT_539416 [Aspergillus ruber CBS 135680]